MTEASLPALPRPGQLASLDGLAAVPEEEVWLASQKSARTRRAYRLDVAHLMRMLGIATPDQLGVRISSTFRISGGHECRRSIRRMLSCAMS